MGYLCNSKHMYKYEITSQRRNCPGVSEKKRPGTVTQRVITELITGLCPFARLRKLSMLACQDIMVSLNH